MEQATRYDEGADDRVVTPPGPGGALEDALAAVIAERVRELRLQLGLTVPTWPS